MTHWHEYDVAEREEMLNEHPAEHGRGIPECTPDCPECGGEGYVDQPVGGGSTVRVACPEAVWV